MSTRDRVLKRHLADFVEEGVACLARFGEWPRRILTAPQIYGDLDLERELSSLPSYRRLRSYLGKRGIYSRLRNCGHTWIWHREVFEYLFLERVVMGAHTHQLLGQSLEQVYRRAEREVFCDYLTLRRVQVIHGFPRITRPMRIAPGIRLAPFDLNSCGPLLYDLLGIECQSHDVGRWLHTYGILLIHDREVPKVRGGELTLRALDDMRELERILLTAIRLALPGVIHPGKSFETQVSAFPLFPLQERTHWEAEQRWHESTRALGRGDRDRIRRAWRMLTTPHGSTGQRGSFWIALRRCYSSYRLFDHDDNILDLIVALEALYEVQDEELRRRLATRVAFLLGRTEKARQHIYRLVSGGYRLRNALVHGKANPEEELERALAYTFDANRDEFRGEEQIEKGLSRAAVALRPYVRASLWAYARLSGLDGRLDPPPGWPAGEELDRLVLDSARRRVLQKACGIASVDQE